MKKFIQGMLVTGSLLLFAGCGAENTNDESNINEGANENTSANADENEELMITTSFSVLGDIIGEITGDRASVEYIVPIGEEPHEYEPVPSNFARVSDSDVFYTNGLGLEEWLEKIVENASDTPIVDLSAGVEEIPLEGEDAPDPHAWLSPKNINIYVNNLLEDLVERDPDGEEEYRDNAEAYLNEIQELDGWIEEQVAEIREEHRKIIVSENAFKYFGKDYGFETEGVWEINSHEEGTPQQINRIIDIVSESGLPAVFVETTVDKRYMETVADNSGVPIAGEVYTDAVGEEGSGAETYIDMIRHNVEVFVDGLTSD
ncbi:metal ABC transporter substrate-binding protein [Evansella sp. LMS18]|uniref:metal ABC transporter substrate-binding protein n=1 Tax=Evansella sp. LMS18 TaxID=2924033 RepID=UPI0020D1B410|nr:metal ABC transporter substrate-binding protein [Evansella sp. LMS18]UTR11680.1 metal ABC transporter substrate-binding protein [Evansella sp. LMS18]